MLHYVAEVGDVELWKKLVSEGQVVAARDGRVNALHLAHDRRRNDVVLVLALEALRMVVQVAFDSMELHEAALVGGVDLCRKLVSDGHLVAARNKRGKAPTAHAHRHSECRGASSWSTNRIQHGMQVQIDCCTNKILLTRSRSCIVHIMGAQRHLAHFLLPPSNRRRTVSTRNTLTENPFQQESISPGNSDLPRVTGPWRATCGE